MPQSFLVVLGVALASMVALQQTRAEHHTQGSLDSLTLQTAATAVAAEQLAFLEDLPFDEGVKAAVAPSVAALTPVVEGVFVRTLSPDPPADDLDDFNGLQRVVSTVLREGAAAQPMTTTITVQYVSEADLTMTSLLPTRFKRATVIVITPGTAPVRLSQLYSCAGYCAW